MKKYLKILALLLTLLFVFAACVPAPPIPDPDGTIEQPSIPEQPVTPDTPDTPGTPDTPDTPDTPTEEPFENYGKKVIDIYLSKVNVVNGGKYTSMEQVAAHIYLFHCLPSNFMQKKDFRKNAYTSENMLSTGGDRFYNREGFLPTAAGRTYTECDIDYTGGNRNAKRIVYSSDWLIFYTSDHYVTFSILRFHP